MRHSDVAEILRTFERALSRESYNLSRWPEVTWQQLHNRLQWEQGPIPGILHPERDRRGAPGARPWFRTRTPFAESKRLIGTLSGHTDAVTGCAVSPDGAFVVSASADGTLRIWDPGTGVELVTLAGHGGPVGDCAVSPDGAFVVSASTDGTLRLWDSGTGLEILRLEGHTGPVAVAPDGSYVVAGAPGNVLRVWDVRTPRELCQFKKHDDSVFDCAVSPDGAFVVSAGRDGLRIWNPRKGKQLHALSGIEHAAFGCAVSPHSTLVASGGWKALTLVDSRTGQERGILKGHSDLVLDCAFSPDGALIVSASLDGAIKVWDPASVRDRAEPPHVASDVSIATLWGHAGTVTCCSFSPEGSFLVSGGDDRTLRLWAGLEGEAETPEAPTGVEGHFDKVNACAVSPDRSWVVSAGGPEDCTLRMWDTHTGRQIRTLGPDIPPNIRENMRSGSITFDHPPPGHSHSVNGCAVALDGSLVVSAGGDGALKLWDPRSGQELRSLLAHGGEPIYGCTVAPDGSYIVSASKDGTLKVWDRQSGRELRTLGDGGEAVHACAVSPDGSFLVSAGGDGTLKVWDPHTGEELRTLRGHTRAVLACAVSPDCAFLVSASADLSVKLWDPATGTELRTLSGARQRFTDCAVSSDGAFVLCASADRLLGIWSAETGERLGLFPATEELLCVATGPHGSLVACGEGTAGPVRERAGRRRLVYLLDLVGIGGPSQRAAESATPR